MIQAVKPAPRRRPTVAALRLAEARVLIASADRHGRAVSRHLHEAARRLSRPPARP